MMLFIDKLIKITAQKKTKNASFVLPSTKFLEKWQKMDEDL